MNLCSRVARNQARSLMKKEPPATPKKPRERKCQVCKKKFRPFSSFISWCSPDCGSVVGMARLARRKAAESAEDRKRVSEAKKEHKTRLEAARPLSWHLARAQTAFNRYIKARDYGKPCGCCGRPMDWARNQDIDCGHYRSRGAAGHLRYDEDNAAAQSVYCNRNKSGNQAEFRASLIARIGIERVEALENNNAPRNWTREELLEITMTYRAKLKELKNARA